MVVIDMEHDVGSPRRLGLEEALDFLNTLEHSRDGDIDHLGSLEVALDWLDMWLGS